MNSIDRHRIRTVHLSRAAALVGAALLAGAAIAPSGALGQTFLTYRCADRTEFIVGFFESDTRAHLQLDGKALALSRRLALSGTRYSGGGVTLKISKTATTLKHAKRAVTKCELN